MDDAERFLSALFRPYPADDRLRVELRCLHLDEQPPRRAWFPITPDGIATAARNALQWSSDTNVYMGVLPRIGKGRAEDVVVACWLWTDIDAATPEDAARMIREVHLPVPSLVVMSGGGVHIYWPLASPVNFYSDLARLEFKSLLRRICDRIGGDHEGAHADPSCCDVARILRVPNTLNQKRGKRVQLLRLASDAGLEYETWRNMLPPPPPPIRPPARPVARGMGIPDGLRRWADEGYPEGHRHKDLVAAAAWLVHDVQVTKTEAEELLIAKARASAGNRYIDTEEIESMVRWA